MDFNINAKIQQQLKELGVITLYLFGSRAQGISDELSDFDFAVLMDKSGVKRGDKTYDVLYDLLSPLCPRTLQNDVIDIVFLNKASLELRFHVIRYGKVLFDAQPLQRGRFEERTLNEYCDFKPLLNIFDKTILASI